MTRYKSDKKCKECGARLDYSYTFSTYLCPDCYSVYKPENFKESNPQPN